jgi:hypothetical protein
MTFAGSPRIDMVDDYTFESSLQTQQANLLAKSTSRKVFSGIAGRFERKRLSCTAWNSKVDQLVQLKDLQGCDCVIGLTQPGGDVGWD